MRILYAFKDHNSLKNKFMDLAPQFRAEGTCLSVRGLPDPYILLLDGWIKFIVVNSSVDLHGLRCDKVVVQLGAPLGIDYTPLLSEPHSLRIIETML